MKMIFALLFFFKLHVSLATLSPYNLENEDLFEGDLFIPELMVAAKQEIGYFTSVMALRKNKQWSNGVMPYLISIKDTSALKVIKSALQEWKEKTCVRFVPRTNQKNFVEFITGAGGCWSNGIGMNGNGKQRINLDRGCWHHGIVVHEIGHALGFWHEQSRPDRDDYVEIIWNNIKSGLDSQFKKYTHNIDPLGVGYDYDSIMHYSRRAFSKNGKDTIVPKKAGARIGQRSGLSRLDALQGNLLYKCFPTTVAPTTGNGQLFEPTGSIIHFKSMMCLFPLNGQVEDDNHPVVASSNCTGEMSRFTFLLNGNVQHVSSGMCLHPTGNCIRPEENTEVVLSEDCKNLKRRFVIKQNGEFVHLLSRTCVRPATENVEEGTRFVIHSECDIDKYAFGFSASPPESRNIALRKKTAQSSTGHGGVSSRAVDGSRNNNYLKYSCTHTLWSKSPWWRVDLGNEFDVTNIYVTNREDCCWERIQNFQIAIGNSLVNQGRDNPLCGGKYSIKRGETKNCMCKPSLIGRYVTIFIKSNRYTPLTLCEVEVYNDLFEPSLSPPTTRPIPDIRGVLQHSSSKLCINPKYKTVAKNTPVTLTASCSGPFARFEVLSDGSLKHVASSMCLSPKNGCIKSSQDTELVLVDQCQTKTTVFEFKEEGALMHVESNTCVRPSSEPVPREGTTMVILNTMCDGKKHKFDFLTAPPEPPTSLPVTGDCGHVLVKSTMVIGGVDAKPGAWPWQVAVQRHGRFICGGSLVKENWVLTAAHCVSRSASPGEYSVVVGDHNRNKHENTEVTLKVNKFFRHPDYMKPYPYNNDVALFQLGRPVKHTSFINTVCLPPQDYRLPISGSTCFITGWGKIRHPGSSHPILQQANMPPVTNTACHKKLKQTPGSSALTITENMLCAGKENTNLSGCHGDSGGPYVCKHDNGRWYLHGSVSWGSPTCSATQRYTVFARIAKFSKWIENITNKNTNA